MAYKEYVLSDFRQRLDKTITVSKVSTVAFIVFVTCSMRIKYLKSLFLALLLLTIGAENDMILNISLSRITLLMKLSKMSG
jgi:uncharacterized membrane protein